MSYKHSEIDAGIIPAPQGGLRGLALRAALTGYLHPEAARGAACKKQWLIGLHTSQYNGGT